jgi:transposase
VTTSVTAKRLNDDSLIILAHNLLKRIPLDLYRSRWSIETLFRSLKTNQFNIESTSIAAPLKLQNLIRPLAKVGIIFVGLPGVSLRS